jgi:uncharacterized membrane protein YgaE (UPF0421/DUF939 family)
MSEAGLRTRLRRRVLDPVAWTDLLQLGKTVVAAVASWVVATFVFGLPQSFLAPWSALLVVHATVYRTLAEGVQQVAATVLGVALAWVTGNLLGLDPLALGVMVLAALVIGRIPPLRLDGTAVAATAVIVLTIGQSDDKQVLLLRFFDTGIGIVVGLLVNLVVWPPLRDLSAARAIDAIDDQVGELLRDMAECLRAGCSLDDVRSWVERSRDIDEDINEAWAYVRQASESGRLNPRRGASKVKQTDQFADLLRRMEQAVADIRSMARTLAHSLEHLREWDEEFKARWVELLAEAGAAIEEPDSKRIAGVRLELQDLAYDLSTDDLSAKYWSEYGGLILNLRNIVTAMDRVAESNPVTSPTVDDYRRQLRG